MALYEAAFDRNLLRTGSLAVAAACVAIGIDDVAAASRLREGLVGVCGAALACEPIATEVPQDRLASLATYL